MDNHYITLAIPKNLLSISAEFQEGVSIATAELVKWSFEMPAIDAYLADAGIKDKTHLTIMSDKQLGIVFHDADDAIIFKLKML